jgi:polyhydroxyalkanoate synthesis regulator phasin
MQEQLEYLSTIQDAPWASQRAAYALQVAQGVQSGQLSTDEAKEILSDLVSTDKLDQDATDAQIKATLVFGVSQLISMMA